MEENFTENIFQDETELTGIKKNVPQKIPYRQKFSNALLQFTDLETARNRAAHQRWKTIENLDKYLIAFEANVIKTGGRVLWAVDAAQAQQEILTVAQNNTTKKIDAGSPVICNEIDLHNFLSSAGFELLNRKNKNSRIELSHEVISILQASFLIADSGSAVIIPANAEEKNVCAGTQIIIATIDSILPTVSDLDLFLPLLSTYKNGDPFPAGVQIVSSVKKEADAAVDFYILLIDNGRSHVMAQEIQRQAMHCIQCGACENVCPVAQNNSQKKSHFSFPAAAVALPWYNDFKENISVSQSSTLCGQCTDVCPVNIDFKKGILANRKTAVESKTISSREKWFYFLWKKTMLSRNFINLRGIGARGHVMDKIFFPAPLHKKNIPAEKKSFNEQWRERMKM